MLRSAILAAVVVVVSSPLSVLADDLKKPNGPDKSEVKKGEKGRTQKKIQKENERRLDKTKAGETKPSEQKITKTSDVKKGHAEKQPAAVVARDTDYYTTSPAQGRPADGQLKAGTKVRVVERAGSYVRVVAEIEAYVSADSFKELENQKEKVVFEKEAALKTTSADKTAEKKAADKKPVVQKKGGVDKAAWKKTSAAGDKTAEKIATDKKPVVEKKGGVIDKAAFKKNGAAADKTKNPAIKKGIEKNEVKK